MAWWCHKATQVWVNIGLGNGLLPNGTKPLPEPMLTSHRLDCISQQVLKLLFCIVSLKVVLELTLTCRDRVISVSLGQYQGYWCPGSLRRQDISSHDIDYVECVGPSLTWGSILSTCIISMWSNGIKCKYMFMFPLKNLARKGLSWAGHSLRQWNVLCYRQHPSTHELTARWSANKYDTAFYYTFLFPHEPVDETVCHDQVAHKIECLYISLLF